MTPVYYPVIKDLHVLRLLYPLIEKSFEHSARATQKDVIDGRIRTNGSWMILSS